MQSNAIQNRRSMRRKAQASSRIQKEARDALGSATQFIEKSHGRMTDEALSTRVSSIAKEGLSGPFESLPYRREMESAFGLDLSGVKVYRGTKAKKAAQTIGAKAYTIGNRIAFGDDDVTKPVVAHELTHVLQGVGATHAKTAGIDTRGEAQAQAVEQAVASGKETSPLLGNQVRLPLSQVSEGPVRAKAGEHQVKLGLPPRVFAMNFAFSKEGFETSKEFTILKLPKPIPIPLATLGPVVIRLVLDPTVKVVMNKVAVDMGAKKGASITPVGVTGELSVALQGGYRMWQRFTVALSRRWAGLAHSLSPNNRGRCG